MLWQFPRLVAPHIQKNEFSLGASVLHSVEEYVDGLGTILLQVFVIKGIGCIIFHLYSCWGLWVPHFFQSCAFWDRFLCIYKLCSDLCLCYRFHGICRDFSHIVDGEIFWGGLHFHHSDNDSPRLFYVPRSPIIIMHHCGLAESYPYAHT